jgi:hypothetical protein
MVTHQAPYQPTYHESAGGFPAFRSIVVLSLLTAFLAYSARSVAILVRLIVTYIIKLFKGLRKFLGQRGVKERIRPLGMKGINEEVSYEEQ